MPLTRGNYVIHPNCPEWGVGVVGSTDHDGTVEINFSEVGVKRLRLDRVSFQLERVAPPREQTTTRHKEFLSRKGIVYRGVRRPSKYRQQRITHCYSCKSDLDNKIDLECCACSWILCECGACGCGYERF